MLASLFQDGTERVKNFVYGSLGVPKEGGKNTTTFCQEKTKQNKNGMVILFFI